MNIVNINRHGQIWYRFAILGFILFLLLMTVGIAYHTINETSTRVDHVPAKHTTLKQRVRAVQTTNTTFEIVWPKITDSEELFMYIDRVKVPAKQRRTDVVYIDADGNQWLIATMDAFHEGEEEDDGTQSFAFAVFTGIREVLKQKQGKPITLTFRSHGELPIVINSITIGPMRVE